MYLEEVKNEDFKKIIALRGKLQKLIDNFVKSGSAVSKIVDAKPSTYVNLYRAARSIGCYHVKPKKINGEVYLINTLKYR